MVEKLKETGLKATPQRIAILRELDKKEHPTIDELYNNLKKTHPSISLATIYKNLNMLKEAGLAIEIIPPSANEKSRFDIYLEPHIHIMCKECGKVYDYYIKDAVNECSMILKELTNQEVENINVLGLTLCEECRKKKKS